MTPSRVPDLVLGAEVLDCGSRPVGRRLAPPCFVHGQAFEGVIEDGAGKSGARLRLNAALESEEDGHVAGLQVRRASWWDEAQHDVRKSGPDGGQGGLAGVDAGHAPEEDPRLSLLARVHHGVQSGRELHDRGRRCPAVLRRDVMSALRPGMLGQDGVCLAGVHDLHQHVQRATVHAEGDRECRGLPLRCPAAGPARRRGGPTRSVAPAGGLVDVHDAICADCVLVHQPAQLDEEPVRLGLL